MRLSDPNGLDYLAYLDTIATDDAEGLKEAQRHYGNSWKVRGGVGAFMMLARKWDRLERRVGSVPIRHVDRHENPTGDVTVDRPGDRYDILMHLMCDDRGEGLIDDIRDLRRYLMLVEAEAMAMGLPCAKTKHRDTPRPEHTT